MNKEGIIRVSPLTKQRLDAMKKTDKSAGLNSTMGGIVDRLVENEYKSRKAEAV